MQTNERQHMKATSSKLTFKIPYALRHLQSEVKNRGGRFQADDKTWTLDENEANEELVSRISMPSPSPAAPPAERVRNVAETAAELLNALKIGHFKLIEATPSRIVIQGGAND